MSSDHRWDNKPIRTLTTGNTAFAECKLLCRVSKIGHSAKTALGKEFFVECRALGKEGCGRTPLRGAAYAECRAFAESLALDK